VTAFAFVLLGVGGAIILLAGVAGFLWIVQVILNAHEAGQKSS
jgi:4-hydroxybenzoate polyprenyltransferase